MINFLGFEGLGFFPEKRVNLEKPDTDACLFMGDRVKLGRNWYVTVEKSMKNLCRIPPVGSVPPHVGCWAMGINCEKMEGPVPLGVSRA